MKYSFPITVICPMCGIVNTLRPEIQRGVIDRKPFIVLCDGESGGCDRYFVAEVTLNVTVRTATYQETK